MKRDTTPIDTRMRRVVQGLLAKGEYPSVRAVARGLNREWTLSAREHRVRRDLFRELGIVMRRPGRQKNGQ